MQRNLQNVNIKKYVKEGIVVDFLILRLLSESERYGYSSHTRTLYNAF